GPEDEPSAAASSPATVVRAGAWPPPAIARMVRPASTTGSARTLAVRIARPGVRLHTRSRMLALSVSRRTRDRGISATPVTPRHQHGKAKYLLRAGVNTFRRAMPFRDERPSDTSSLGTLRTFMQPGRRHDCPSQV